VLLERLAGEGSVVKVGALLALIGQSGENAPAAKAPQATAPAAAPAEPVPATAGRGGEGAGGAAGGFISPVVARLAAEHRLDLSRITGSGLGGRITKKDVLAYLDSRPAEAAAPTPALPPAPAAGDELLPFTAVRRQIAEHMVHSKRTSPHVTTVMEVDLSRVAAHREAHKAAFARDGANLTFTAYFVAAAVQALKAYPLVNSSWTDEGLLLHHGVHIGMATSLGEAGLIVPVIRDADRLSLLGLARTINDLAARARARKLQPEEVRGGTFTLTNHGISGSLFATPIINQPQCGILGVGAIQKRVVVVTDANGQDSIAIRPLAYVSLTFDHRILDGASADNFLAKVVESLKNLQEFS
jgi:2-oxoglutarate dehydrogenase E2 component (dihydrolipoamide succinyltransferase)